MAFTCREPVAQPHTHRLLTRDRGRHVTQWRDEPNASKLKQAAGSVALLEQPGHSRQNESTTEPLDVLNLQQIYKQKRVTNLEREKQAEQTPPY